MGTLYLMTTIVDRKIAKKYSELYKENKQYITLVTMGAGTAVSEMLNYLGLESNEKAVIFSVQEEETWQQVKKQLQQKLHIDAPGGGIAFTIPLSSIVMDAARDAGAYGGTVIHAKGTGMEQAEKFMGVSLAAEKEMIFIVAKKEQKNQIMQAIMEKAGLDSKAKSIVFSLPVTDTAGLRLIED